MKKMNEMMNELGIFKEKETLLVSGLTVKVLDDLRTLCKGYDVIDQFLRPCTPDEIEFDYHPEEDISDEVQNEVNRQEAILQLTRYLFHHLHILEDEELTKLNGKPF